MSKKITLKEIAELSGVSAGTVDRVLHRRGKVSEKSRLAVEKVLKSVNYQPDLMLSSISIKRTFKIAVAIPICKEGEYWSQIQSGILKSVKKYNHIDIDCQFVYYNQFDLFSCREVFHSIAHTTYDGVIIGPTFKDETIVLANTLDDKHIPYVYVDSMVYDTSPISFFSANQQECGYLLAKLLYQITPEGADFVICQTKRIGDESANNTIMRKIGFLDFFKEKGLESHIKRLLFSATDPQANDELIGNFFKQNPSVRGAVVLSSRGYIILNFLKKKEIHSVSLVTMDLTQANEEALRNNELGYVICQRPSQQGFSAFKALMMHLMFGKEAKLQNYMPLDIITKENLKYYHEIIDN